MELGELVNTFRYECKEAARELGFLGLINLSVGFGYAQGLPLVVPLAVIGASGVKEVPENYGGFGQLIEPNIGPKKRGLFADVSSASILEATGYGIGCLVNYFS